MRFGEVGVDGRDHDASETGCMDEEMDEVDDQSMLDH
jgi:hypothetical protein